MWERSGSCPVCSGDASIKRPRERTVPVEVPNPFLYQELLRWKHEFSRPLCMIFAWFLPCQCAAWETPGRALSSVPELPLETRGDRTSAAAWGHEVNRTTDLLSVSFNFVSWTSPFILSVHHSVGNCSMIGLFSASVKHFETMMIRIFIYRATLQRSAAFL